MACCTVARTWAGCKVDRPPLRFPMGVRTASTITTLLMAAAYESTTAATEPKRADATTEAEWAVAGRAVQLAEWARTHRFCGRCATPTEQSPNDRSMKCPACGLLAYPRLAPAMITLVTKGEPGPDQQVLLARGVQFRAPMYSCLAGFVEPGESLEEAVIREVQEEVGVVIGKVEYRGSQPWPFPHSLMIGFRAAWESGEIVCEPTEILDAQWYRRDALPPIPPPISIARKLIDAWLAED
ncbi:MAG: NAD(+) diphosphatase [Acidimicrobiaceae bacterium]|nr:NAD(+) diphosphatase [Acidimicrobiaceae bacterium]